MNTYIFKKYTYIPLIIVGLGLSLLSKTIITNKKAEQALCLTKTITFDTSMEPTITQLLQETDNSIWHDFAQIGISKKEVEEKTAYWIKEYSRREQLHKNNVATTGLSHKTEQFIRTIIAHIKDPRVRNVCIKLSATQEPFIAYSSLDTITVNEALFNAYSEKARTFIITHEVAHIVFQDPLVQGIIEMIGELDTRKLAQSNPNHPACKYSRLTEWRADLWACQNHHDALEGYQAFCTEVIKKDSHQPMAAKTHPLDSNRLACANACIDINPEILNKNLRYQYV